MLIKQISKRFLRCYVDRWRSFSKLFLVADDIRWSIAQDMRELKEICSDLGIKTPSSKLAAFASHQCIYVGSHFDLLLNSKRLLDSGNRLATAYFHGKPGKGVDEFDLCYQRLKKFHNRISRIQVSCSEMENIILESGIDSKKVFLIPIGINLNYFPTQTSLSRKNARKILGISESAVVVGSFQKDGQGWGDGLEPKMIKGPDIFLKTIEILKESVPELFVLLSGPARGYVKVGLERLKVPYKHVYQKSYAEIGTMFQALDLYISASREEGGPKAVLESMASGVPLVTTRVGQATDLVEHGINGWTVQPEDYEGLAHWATLVLQDNDKRNSASVAGRITAERNSYTAQISLWRDFMSGFVDR